MSKDLVFDAVSKLLSHQSRLLSSKPVLEPDETHDLRVAVKRSRSYLRLYRQVAAPKDFVRVDGTLKQVAASFAAQRDLIVQITLLERLGADLELAPGSLNNLKDLLTAASRDNETPDPDHLLNSANLLLVAESWRTCIKQTNQSFIQAGLNRTYRKARLLGKEAVHEADPEYFHKWRKWSKYYLYQLQLLANLEIYPADKKLIKQLKKLGEDLGDLSDLVDCHQRLSGIAGQFDDAKLLHKVQRSIHQRTEALVNRCAARRKEIYTRKHV